VLVASGGGELQLHRVAVGFESAIESALDVLTITLSATRPMPKRCAPPRKSPLGERAPEIPIGRRALGDLVSRDQYLRRNP
jgi:hypothetical protein